MVVITVKKNIPENLKRNKSRDPHGFINEIFKPEVAGQNFIDGLLMLYNEVKRQQKILEIFQLANVSSFYQGKGAKDDMNN